MSEERRPIASVEGVREELRRLGYLDSGLDRFVLAGAGGRSPLNASLAVAARVGLAGGVLFGLTLALAAVGLDRHLLAEPRDLAVLTLYLGVAAGLVTGLAALGGGLIAASVAHRQPLATPSRLTRDLGLLLALVGLAYLALWWRSHAFGAPLAAQVAGLVVGLGLSLVLARFGSLAVVAVLSTTAGPDRLPEARLSRHRLVPLLAAALVLLASGLAVASYFGAGRGSEPPDFAVIPTGLHVSVLGIDGLEWNMAQQMLARGEMPGLRALLDQGARARLQAEPEQVPAIVWTTIATGRGPAAHGIQSMGSRRLAGMRTAVSLGSTEGPFASALTSAADLLRITRRQPPTAVLRSVKAFWNVASEKGLRVGVAGWWATWPAEPVNGWVISDRAFFKVERAKAPDRDVYPPESFATLPALLPAVAGGGQGPAPDRARRIDRFTLAAAESLSQGHPPDLEAVYLPGLDIFTMQQLGETAASDLASLDARLESVRAYYRFVDGLLAATAAQRGPDSVLVVVGDPGRLPRRAGQPALGVLVLAGATVAATDLGTVSERDLAPTVLHLAGLPVSAELEGKVLEQALAPEFRQAHPVRTVASYGRRPLARPAPSAFDHAMVEELKSLGYIQ